MSHILEIREPNGELWADHSAMYSDCSIPIPAVGDRIDIAAVGTVIVRVRSYWYFMVDHEMQCITTVFCDWLGPMGTATVQECYAIEQLRSLCANQIPSYSPMSFSQE